MRQSPANIRLDAVVETARITVLSAADPEAARRDQAKIIFLSASLKADTYGNP